MRTMLGRPRNCHPPRRGFTAVELCIGIVITSLVMAAVASFSLATAQSWRQTEQTSSATTRARQAAMRITRIVQNCALIGASESSDSDHAVGNPPAVLLWIRDANQDGLIQPAECGMIEFDPSQRVLRYYHPGQGDADAPLPWEKFSQPTMIPLFKQDRQWTPLARRVESANFAVHWAESSSLRPTLEFALTVSDHDRSIDEFGACSVRAPARQPS